MRRGVRVTSPDGDRWRVRRRWSDRRLPKVRRRFRKTREEVLDDETLTGLWALDFSDGIVLTVGSLFVLALLVLVLVPLIGVALELIAVLALVGFGVVARVVLGRPWTVEAVDIDHPQRSVAYAVKGWRRSSRAIQELRRQIAVAGPPDEVGT